MQCACVTLSSVDSPILKHFSTLSHKRNDFRKEKEEEKKVIEHKMYVLIFSTNVV